MPHPSSTSALLVGMQTGAATVEDNVEFPQKTENGTALDPAVPLLSLIHISEPTRPITTSRMPSSA